jgi:hypothetical protein
VDPSELPQGVEKFDQALRSLLGSGAIVVDIRPRGFEEADLIPNRETRPSNDDLSSDRRKSSRSEF